MFKARTVDAYVIKTLVDLLQHNLKMAYFKISENGICLRMMDAGQKILFNVFLDGTKFNIYKYKYKSTNYNIGVNLLHLFRMIKSIKKKDSITLFIREGSSDLGIEVSPRDNSRTTTSYLKTFSTENLDIEMPKGYKNSIIINSSEYQKMCKDMNSIGPLITIHSNMNGLISFKCDDNNIYKREVIFGTEDSDSEDEDIDNQYSEVYNTEQLHRITKISGLHQKLNIFVEPRLPILFKSNVGALGAIDIYIKNKNQIEQTNC